MAPRSAGVGVAARRPAGYEFEGGRTAMSQELHKIALRSPQKATNPELNMPEPIVYDFWINPKKLAKSGLLVLSALASSRSEKELPS